MRSKEFPSKTSLPRPVTGEGRLRLGCGRIGGRDGAPVGAKTGLKRAFGVLSRRGQAPRSDKVTDQKRCSVSLSVAYNLGRMGHLGSASGNQGAPEEKATGKKRTESLNVRSKEFTRMARLPGR